HLGFAETFLDRAGQGCLVIGGYPEIASVGSGANGERREQRPVAVPDPARAGRLGGLHELVAGRKDSDPWPPPDRHHGSSARRENADLSRADEITALEERRPCAAVGAAQGDAVAPPDHP